MANGIGAADAPMGAIGSLLAGQGASAPPNADSALQAVMGQIRQIGQAVQALEGQNPALAEEAQQITQLLKAMVIKSAQQGSAQTASGMAVPGAGGGA